MARAQNNSVAEGSQFDLFGAPAAPVYRPDADKVRARLEKILGEAKAAAQMPWEPAQLSLYRTIFPQMTEFLAPEEAEFYRLAFAAELQRLDPELC